jgi:hypothetical protein
MTLDDAVRVARSIQRDLEAGRLTVPYPEKIRVALRVCLSVFAREGDTAAKAQAITARLEAASDPTDVVVPAW